MSNRRNAWKKQQAASEGSDVGIKKAKHTNKRSSNPDPARKGPKDGPDLSAIPKVGTLRQWDKNMKTEARIRRRPNGVSVRTNPDPPPPPVKKVDGGKEKPPSKKRR